MIKGDTPSAAMLPTVFAFRRIYFLRIRMTLFFEVRNHITQRALTAWEMIVASAAPRTPIPAAKIRIGSSTMLITAPISTENMAILAFPCPLINVLSPTANCTNMVPIK